MGMISNLHHPEAENEFVSFLGPKDQNKYVEASSVRNQLPLIPISFLLVP